MAGAGFLLLTSLFHASAGSNPERRVSMILNGAEVVISMLQCHGISIVAGIPAYGNFCW
jgi:hypothetical protein